ncbi:hypothetical protein [Methylorubrum populi]|uniref:hypothetical protein n=1 Tax=Methylorubrum populi TaxID=223967 RepID=UPI003F658297
MEKRVGWVYPGRLAGARVTMHEHLAWAGVGVVRAGGRLSRSFEGNERAQAPSLPLMAVEAFLPALSAARQSKRVATVPLARVFAWRLRASSMFLGREGAGVASTTVMGMSASPPAGHALTIQAMERFERRARTNGKASPSSRASVVGLS